MCAHKLYALAVMLSVFASPARAQLAAGRERIPHAEVFLANIHDAAGYTLRAFVTHPQGKPGKLPVLFMVGWLSCDSVEAPNGPEDGFLQLMFDLASRSGLATYRLEKPGVGESGGPKCDDLDFATELAAYRSGFAALKEIDFIDASRAYLIGFSNGGAFAPLVASGENVRGYLVFSGWYKTWLEHMLELERRRMKLSSVPETDINSRMKLYATFYELYLNQRLMPGAILAQRPELKGIWYDEPNHQYGRPASFFHQLQALNLAEAWGRVNVPVLAVHGEYDWIMSGDDYKLLADAINEHHPGLAEFKEWPHADHVLLTHADAQHAFGRDAARKYDPQLSDYVLKWLQIHETTAAN